MKEHEAFTFLQRTAMSERGRMRDVAERVIAGGLRPPESSQR
jgi:response regulator NasT